MRASQGPSSAAAVAATRTVRGSAAWRGETSKAALRHAARAVADRIKRILPTAGPQEERGPRHRRYTANARGVSNRARGGLGVGEGEQSAPSYGPAGVGALGLGPVDR